MLGGQYNELGNSFTNTCRKPKEKVEEDPHPKLKVELQTLRLNPESQRIVLDTLRYLHGPDFKLGAASSYKVGFMGAIIMELPNCVLMLREVILWGSYDIVIPCWDNY